MPAPRADPAFSARPWRFAYSPKYASDGVTRTVPPVETIGRVEALMPAIGVTRVAEVTNLDRLGIPNFMCVRPLDKGPGITYYNGKGYNRLAAKAGAMMEAIERYSGERIDLPVIVDSQAGLGAWANVIDAGQLIVPTVRPFDPLQPLEWVEGYDLLADEPCWAPLNAVICPYEGRVGTPPVWYSSTNGLASGNTIEEAVCHALCEVIERHALALSFTAMELVPAVSAILGQLGHPAIGLSGHDYPLIDPASLPARARGVAERFAAAGLILYLRDLTPAFDLPTFDCAVVEQHIGGFVVHGGCGTHPDARVAVGRALTEAAQSRVACIQGGREDLPEIIAPPQDFDPEAFYGGGEVRPFQSVPSFENDSVDEDIRFLLDRARAGGFERVVVFDLTRPELGIPVVRIVAPGAEAWTVFHLHTGRGVFGGTVSNLLRGSA